MSNLQLQPPSPEISYNVARIRETFAEPCTNLSEGKHQEVRSHQIFASEHLGGGGKPWKELDFINEAIPAKT